ncbi:MAG TPA: cupin domain-containing protein [Mycobacteriales bacterium]|nr:cupin domain-containing protein [Mycobacteriales bacterium]
MTLRHIDGGSLSGDTAQSSGMLREEAISGATVGSDRLWMGRTTVRAAARSADHHHGESETAIYVVSGHPEFVFLDGEEERRVRTDPGDYVYVPPFTPHREENPSATEDAVVVIARTTQEAIVVNLPGLRSEPGR